MEGKASRTCAICHQIKPLQYFPKTTRKGRLLAQANICLACRAATSASEDDEGGGGKQSQHSRDAKQLQYEMELEAALLKERESLDDLTHHKDIFGMSQVLENERKKQASQRELLDLKEDLSKINQNDDEPNPDLAQDTQVRREKITRLFSVTRSLARNYVAANNNKAIAQKNFGLFSAIKGSIAAHKKEVLLSSKSSGLFSQQEPAKQPVEDEAEQLANAIREGQKIFNR